MKSALEWLWWAVRTAILFVVALLFLRSFFEYLPELQAKGPVRSFLGWLDPLLASAVAPSGRTLTHDILSLGTLGVGVALMVLRTIGDDVVTRLLAPPKPPKKKPAPAPAPAPAAEASPKPSVPVPPAASDTRPGARAPRPEEMPTQLGAEAAMMSTMLATGSHGGKTGAGGGDGTVARIGRYDIVSELGRGAMGTVYKGTDPTIGRTVAIKTLSAIPTGPQMQEYRERFLVEARSAGRLNHPGIVSVYDVTDDEQGRPALVLEFVAGTSLDKLATTRKLGLPQALDLVAQIARALAHAHGNGIVHRDVKPANIMVTDDGQAKLSDFGIAKMDGTGMTQAGQVLGTPAFMSPEQCTGAALDSRSDIFSLGSVLYQVATGARPFPGDTFTSVAYNVVHEMPIPPTQVNAALPAALDDIVRKALAKQPGERYASAAEFASDLDALRHHLAEPAEPPMPS